MGITLQASDEKLVEKFSSLKTPRHVSALLEVDYSYLVYLLYKTSLISKYRTFLIDKRAGGFRNINSPNKSLKILQQKLNHILQLVYKPKPSVHGFTLERNIVTNSKSHTKKCFVFNIDLKEFFPSVNFGRVRGMFMAKPYLLPPEAATVLAQICCHNNQLPQGAPTSPIISNMICAKLDSQLQDLAKNNRCVYTRYADDITFSTTLKEFPAPIALVKIIELHLTAEAGDELRKIIQENGFDVNDSKVRIQMRTKRQEVTGLTVNSFPNVNRKYVRQIRAMLHAWEKYGLKRAQEEYNQKYLKKPQHLGGVSVSYLRVVEGKINFLRMVKGAKDLVYGKLANKFNSLAGRQRRRYFQNATEEIFSALWVLECEKSGKQGTAFMLDKVGLVTCQHVLGETTHEFQHNNLSVKYPVRVIAENKDIDLAILRIDARQYHTLRGTYESRLEIADKVTLLGFPNYRKGDTPRMSEGAITGVRPVSGISRLLIDALIVTGNSGGPVLNKKKEVIGIAVTGGEISNAHLTENHGVIPVSALRHLIEK
jgi:RNA-directed DNA polymerase